MAATQQNVVIAQLATARRTVDTYVENIASIIETISEAAQSMQAHDYSSGVEDAKAACLQLLHAEQGFAAHSRATQDMALGYQQPESHLDETNFEELLHTATERHTNANFNAEESDKYKELVKGINEGAEDDGDGDAVDEDGDLVMERGNDLAPNIACPLSLINIMEIEDPVEDSMGFVYQRKSIEDYIRAKPSGVAQAPMSGACHTVRVADLKPARKVLKAQRRARMQPTQTQPTNTDDVLDVD